MKKYLLVFAIAICSSSYRAGAQGLSVNTSGSAADGSAMLDVQSTSQGVLVPRMTNANRNSISSPATGLLIYQTDGTKGFYYNSGTSGSPVWTFISAGAAGGDLTGSYPNPTIATGAGADVVAAINASSSSINAARLQGTVTTEGNTFNGANELVQMTGATKLPGVDGSLLTNLSAGNLAASGTFPAENGSALTALNATQLTTGSVPAAAMPALTTDVTTSAGSVATTIANNATSGNHIVAAIGSATTGTVPVARLGTGTASGTTVLRGDGTWGAPLTLTITGSGAATFSGGTLNIPTPIAGGGYMWTGSANLGPSDGPKYYCFPLTGTAQSIVNEAAVPMAAACTIDAFYLNADVILTAVSGSNIITFVVLVNGVASSMTTSVTVPATASIGASFTANDITHTVSVGAGDLVSVSFTQSNGASGCLVAANVSFHAH